MDIITAVGSAGEIYRSCALGSQVVFSCKYDPLAPTVYFSLGDTVAALGIIFAAYQLADKRWKMRHRIFWKNSDKILWIFSGIGFILAAMASWLPQLGFESPMPPWRYPYFWELSSAACIVLAVAYFVIFGFFRMKLFSRRTAGNLFWLVAGNSSDKDPGVMVDIVYDNLYPIMLSSTREPSMPIDSPEAFADGILNIITAENSFADYIVTTRLDFLTSYIDIGISLGFENPALKNGLNNLVESLFKNQESFLYRQHDYKGVGRYVSIANGIFSNQDVFSNIELLTAWEAYEYPITQGYTLGETYLRTFLDCLEKAWTAYLVKPDNDRSLRFFYGSFDKLTSYCQFLPVDRLGSDREKLVRSRLDDVARFLGSACLRALSVKWQSSDFAEHYRIPRFNDYGGGENVTGLYVEALVNLMDTLSRRPVDKDTEQYYRLTFHSAFYSLLKSDEPGCREMRGSFLSRVWDLILVSTREGSYPAMSSIYFQLINWGSPQPNEAEEYQKAQYYLYDQLLPRIERRELMLDGEEKGRALLPEKLKFNPEKNSFIYIYGDGEILIPRPKPMPSARPGTRR